MSKVNIDHAPSEKNQLIDEIKNARRQVLKNRFNNIENRYPEINTPTFRDLDDEEVIISSLKREWAHQLNVVTSMKDS